MGMFSGARDGYGLPTIPGGPAEVANWGAPIRPDSLVSQLLWRLDVELHPDRGGKIVQSEKKPHQGVQAPVLPAGGHRREASRPDLSRAQPLRERASQMAQGVRGSRRDGFYREATLWRGSSPGCGKAELE